MNKVVTTVDATGGIVVGHDGSPPAALAVRWAARLAARMGCRLHVVRAWALSSAPRPPSWSPGYVPPLTDYEAAVMERLRKDVSALDLGEDVKVSCHAVHGSTSRRLLEASKGAEMLVVASRGIGGFRGLMLGSTAGQLVGHAHCPIVVVPSGSDGDPAEPDAGLTEGHR